MWHGPTVIPLGSVSVRGNPSLIQGRFLSPGNFEMVVPLSTAGLAHFSRVNVIPPCRGMARRCSVSSSDEWTRSH